MKPLVLAAGRGTRARPRTDTVPKPMSPIGNDGYVATLTVPNRTEFVRPAASFLVQTARALSVPGASKPLFDVAVTEAITNAVKHGHGSQTRGTIVCELESRAEQLIIRVLDEGPGFTLPAPRSAQLTPDQVDRLRESGYGLPIIQSVFPVVRSVRVNGRFGLELTLPSI